MTSPESSRCRQGRGDAVPAGDQTPRGYSQPVKAATAQPLASLGKAYPRLEDGSKETAPLNDLLKCFAESGPPGCQTLMVGSVPKAPACPGSGSSSAPQAPAPASPLPAAHTSPRAHTRAQHGGKRGEVGKYLAESNLQKSLIGPSDREAERIERKMLVVVRKAKFCYFTDPPLTQKVSALRNTPFCSHPIKTSCFHSPSLS